MLELLDALEAARDEAATLEPSDDETDVAELATLSPLARRESRSARLAARSASFLARLVWRSPLVSRRLESSRMPIGLAAPKGASVAFRPF